MPVLPPRQVVPASGPVLDPEEPEDIKEVRRRIHGIRVSLIRAAQRLGYDADNGLVRQVLYRLALAEKLRAPWRRAARRPDPASIATREASKLEAEAGAGAPLDFCVKMMFIGLAGTGKTQLAHSLLGNETWQVVDPILGASKDVTVMKGTCQGVKLEIIDTPGLRAAAGDSAANARVLRQIRRAYRKHKPDLVVYVDRLDATSPGMVGPPGPGGGAAGGGAELPALRGVSAALGPQCWLNTIVALTHMGAPPPVGQQGSVISFDHWANARSHAVQQVIRAASGDARLMNPMAYVESHPCARHDKSAALMLLNGMAWRQHLLLMVVSAKLLADTENMLQMQDRSQSAAAIQQQQQILLAQMMGGTGRMLPLPYLTTQATQFSQPLKYPDHDQLMQAVYLDEFAQKLTDPKDKKLAVRQAKAFKLQLKQALKYKEKMQTSFRNATLAGSKITPEPPNLATKRPPSVQPPCTYRYRVPEPAGGWLVRPQLEPHGWDNTDGIEGMQIEQSTVAKRHRHRKAGQPPPPLGSTASTDGLLGGTPMHSVIVVQSTKGQMNLQARSEATLYHDLMGRKTTSLSADVQTTGTPGATHDALVVLRADLAGGGSPLTHNKPSVGVMASRLAEGCRPDKGPLALGARLQDTYTGSLADGAMPLELAASGAVVTAPWGVGETLQGPGAPVGGIGEAEVAFGGNMEISTDMQTIFRTRRAVPMNLSANAIMYKGTLMAALGAALQVRGQRRDLCGGRLQLTNKGRAVVSLKAHSGPWWWTGLIAMAVPITTLLLEFIEGLQHPVKTQGNGFPP